MPAANPLGRQAGLLSGSVLCLVALLLLGGIQHRGRVCPARYRPQHRLKKKSLSALLHWIGSQKNNSFLEYDIWRNFAITFKEYDAILALSITADQTQEVLDLLQERYFQCNRLDDIGREDFIQGYTQMGTVLSLISSQVTDLARSLENLANTAHLTEESA